MTLSLSVDVDTNAFSEDREADTARILRRIADTVAVGYDGGEVLDDYGLRIGTWELEDREDDE